MAASASALRPPLGLKLALRLPKFLRLRKRPEFLRVSARHKRVAGDLLVLQIHHRREGPTRLGITVTRRFGNAPQRNRFKRLVREAFRHHQANLPPAIDIVVRPRSAAIDATYEQIVAEFVELIGGGEPFPSRMSKR